MGFLQPAQSETVGPSIPTLSELDDSNNQYHQRQMQHLLNEISRPFPKIYCEDASADDPCLLGMLNLVLASATMPNEHIQPATLNKNLKNAIARLRVEGWDKEFHFVRAGLLFRILSNFGTNGREVANLIDKDLELEIIKIFYEWARVKCNIADAKRDNTWYFWGSENHGAQLDSTCWAAAMLIQNSNILPQNEYSDGSSAEQQVKAWTEYLKRYIKQHVHGGVLIEYFSPTYTQYTLGPFYNYADFSSDQKLRELATAFLNLWWAVWAQEQIDGKHGGSKARSYPKVISDGALVENIAHLYFGLGSSFGVSPGEALAFSSKYRPASVISDIAKDSVGKGTYDLVSRAPGGSRYPVSSNMWYSVNPSSPSIIRVTRSGPGYTMGLAMLPRLNYKSWVAPSSQNRWSGVVLSGPRDARIVVQPAIDGPRNNYNNTFGMQHGGVQIIQRLAYPYGQDVGRMQIWFGKSIKLQKEGLWLFVDSSAYIAIRPAWGEIFLDPSNHQILRLSDDNSPVIIQVASRSDFQDFPSFKNEVSKLPLEVDGQAVNFRGLADAGRLTWFYNSDRDPEIDGRKFEFYPDFVFQSPFMEAPSNFEKVRVKKGSKYLDLDFR